MSTILVTGGFGMIGKNMQEYLSYMQINFKIVFLKRSDTDLTDDIAVQKLFELVRPDIVVHLASKVGGLYDNMNNNYEFLMYNIRIHQNIIEACRVYRVKRIINVLSTCCFPDNVDYPLKTHFLHGGPPHVSNRGYAYSKRFLHIASKELHEITGAQVINIVPTNLYGKWDNSTHVIPNLINRFKTGDLTVRGTGQGRRQFVYAMDLVRIIYSFMISTDTFTFHDLIVSPPESDEVTILDLAKVIQNVMGMNGEIVCNTSYPDGQELKTTNNQDVLLYFPDFVFCPLKDGITETIRNLKL